jgi:hypothetical protein
MRRRSSRIPRRNPPDVLSRCAFRAPAGRPRTSPPRPGRSRTSFTSCSATVAPGSTAPALRAVASAMRRSLRIRRARKPGLNSPVDDALPVLFQREAARGAAQQHVAHHGRVHALRLRQRDRVGDAQHRAGHRHLVAGLHRLAGAHAPTCVIALQKALITSRHASTASAGPPIMQASVPALGALLAAADRRVEEGDAPCPRRRCANARAEVAAMVLVSTTQLPGPALRQPVLAEQHLSTAASSDRHRNTSSHCAPRRRRRRVHRALRHQRLRRLVAPRVHVQRMPARSRQCAMPCPSRPGR